jgi:hypothetical protein
MIARLIAERAADLAAWVLLVESSYIAIAAYFDNAPALIDGVTFPGFVASLVVLVNEWFRTRGDA